MKKPVNVSNLTLDLYLDYVKPAAIAAGILEAAPAYDPTWGEYTAYTADPITADEIGHFMYCACMNAHHDRHEYTTAAEARALLDALEISAVTRQDMGNTFTALRAAIIAQHPEMAPAAETEHQPTETENAPQAATQAAEEATTGKPALEALQAIRNELKTAPTPATIRAALDAIRQHDPETELTEDDSPRAIKNALQHIINGVGMDAYMEQARAHRAPQAATQTTTEREALERINARQNAANLFTNIGPADIAAELAAMEAERTTPAADPEDITTDEQKEEENTMSNTAFTPIEAAMHAATVRGIIRRQGGYRERDILNHPHTIERGTWTTEHKVVEILATTPDPDGYRPGFAVDIVTRSIVG